MKSYLCKILLLAILGVCAVSPVFAAESTVAKDARCAVCGMFVAKYPNWMVTLTMSDGATKYFDGVKDMMAFYFAPQTYGAKPGATITAIQVKDYYTLESVDAKKAFYVMGSDVTGPMGYELVPFATKEAAEGFSQDHHGGSVLTFEAVTTEQIEALRSGQRMK